MANIQFMLDLFCVRQDGCLERILPAKFSHTLGMDQIILKVL